MDVNPDINVTNDDGIANFTFVANDPQNNRTYIDGQLYPFLYSINSTNTCEDIDLNSLALIRIFDSYFHNLTGLEPTWLDHVYPIFKKYADLYPVMTDNFVDLANYYDVLQHKKAISETIRSVYNMRASEPASHASQHASHASQQASHASHASQQGSHASQHKKNFVFNVNYKKLASVTK